MLFVRFYFFFDFFILFHAALRGKALASRADFARLATEGTPAEKQALSEALGIDDWTALDANTFNEKIIEFVKNGGVERYQKLRELLKSAEALSEADARPMPKLMNMQKDGIRRYSDENSRIAVMKDGDTYRIYDYGSRTVSKELTRTEANAALREYNAKKNAVTSMNQQNMQVTENNSAIDPGSKRMALPENISAYSDEEINSIESRKENIVARSYNDVLEFFEYAVSDQSNEGKTMFIGKISNKTAAKIRKETGMNAFGKSIALNSHDIRHMMKEHGNAKTEAMRNQEAITTENFGHVIETIANPDKITASKNEKSGVTSLIFEKEIAGKTTAITIFSEKRKTLTLKTAWIIKKEQHISQPTNAEALIRTPEARSSMDAVPTDSIPQDSEKVNTSDEKNISKAQTVEKSAAELDSIEKDNVPEYSKLSVPSRVMIRKVLYDALASGYSEPDAIIFARVSARSGLHMTFSKSLCQAARIKGTKDFVYADGYYDPYDNRIVMNPEGTRSVDALLIHELTHAVYKDKRGRIILERGAKNMSDEQKQSIIKSYSKVAKGSSAVIRDEMNAHYIEGQLKNKNLLEALLTDEPTLKDKILSFFKGASTDYAGNAELSGAAKRLFKRYKKLFDSFSAQNQGTNAYGAPVVNNAVQDGKRMAIQFLTDSDLDDYLKAGTRSNNYKQQAIESGKKILLTSEEEIKNYIKKATDGEKDMPTVAYGRVANKLSTDTESYSNGKIKISDYYLELVPNDLYHAYREHLTAKEHGDIDLSFEDFENIPGYLATYDDFVYAIKYKSGNTKICVSKKISDGRVLLIETVSKSHGSIEFKNLIGVSEEKYLQDYKAKYEKRNSTNTRGNESSNTSLRDATVSNNSIPQKSDLSTDIPEKNSSKRFALPEGTDVESVSDASPAERRISDVYSKLMDGNRKFDGYTVYVYRDTANDGATITFKTDSGEKISNRVELGRYMSNEQLFTYAAGYIAGYEGLTDSSNDGNIKKLLTDATEEAQNNFMSEFNAKLERLAVLESERSELLLKQFDKYTFTCYNYYIW